MSKLVPSDKGHFEFGQAVDALLLGAAFYASYLIGNHGTTTFSHFLWIFAVVMPFGPFVLSLRGRYEYPRERNLEKSLGRMAVAGLVTGLMIFVGARLFSLASPSISVFIAFCVLAPALLLIKDAICRSKILI